MRRREESGDFGESGRPNSDIFTSVLIHRQDGTGRDKFGKNASEKNMITTMVVGCWPQATYQAFGALLRGRAYYELQGNSCRETDD